MAVGPLEDLPPHLRNHLVRINKNVPILWSRFVAENHFDSSLQFSVGANLISMHYFWINKSIGGKRSYLLYSIIWWLVVSDFTHIALLFWSLWYFTLLLLHHWHCTSVLPASHQITNMKFNHFLCIQILQFQVSSLRIESGFKSRFRSRFIQSNLINSWFDEGYQLQHIVKKMNFHYQTKQVPKCKCKDLASTLRIIVITLVEILTNTFSLSE